MRFRQNVPVKRQDLEDAVYKTQKEKFRAVCDAIEEAHAKHQPVLVGTITIDNSELLKWYVKAPRHQTQRIECQVP